MDPVENVFTNLPDVNQQYTQLKQVIMNPELP